MNVTAAGSGNDRRAKIVATLGPASSNETTFRELVRAGLDVARLNFSHGTQPEKLKLIEMVRKVAAEEGKVICIMGDLQGPKIRTGRLKNRIPVQLKTGQNLTITPRDIPGTATVISTTFPTLAENLEPGARILLSDGLIELRVLDIPGEDVECEVINGGTLGEHKGINLPGIAVRVPSLTEKDESDLEFAVKSGVDAIAVSFIRTADDVRLVKQRIAALGADTWVVAKLEKPQAIDNLESILDVTDGVMVARGDLGVEMPPEKVPAIQKHVIRRAAEHRKPVITATQMLESMIENPRPTRAEASDVANAVYDGTDAVMLSAESAAGKYPIEAVKMMAKIVIETESHKPEIPVHDGQPNHVRLSIAETICESMAHAAEDLDLAINETDLRIDTLRSGGAGGQHVNKTESAVRITHIPSGIVVMMQEDRSQHRNRAKAMAVLRTRLYDSERQKQDAARAAERRGQVGTGDRSERIRTYNYPQGRVSDHRINLTLYKLPQILEGEALGEIIDALVTEHQAALLAAEETA